MGGVENPSYGTVGVRLQYNKRILGRTVGEVFVDIFNIANTQGAIRTQELVLDEGRPVFGNDRQRITPRRAFLGVRVRF